MNSTLGTFKEQQARSLEILKKLQAFLAQGEDVGVQIDPKLKQKLETALQTVAGDKLKVALVGGYSDGKTSIAAAWMERLDKSSMKISHQESSNEVRVYEVASDFVLIDTPGLFGFKEQENAETHQIEKYKDITKKYVSEAHLILYVMDPANPIKESHKDDLQWLFRTLNLLPRTVFVLSRFDQVADVEDEAEYRDGLAVKQDNVRKRLRDLIDLQEQESAGLAIVGVAANPFDLGTEHWLSNLEQFKKLSHIDRLQEATRKKMEDNGGAVVIVDEAKKSVIRDVLAEQLPRAVEIDEQIAAEIEKLDRVSSRLKKQLNDVDGQISNVRISLRTFVVGYFSDLILQVQGVDMETFPEFFEREVGDNGIVVSTRLQNEFERQLKSVSQEISSMQISFDTEVTHFNSTVMQLGKQGLDYLVRSKAINNTTVLAARDGLVSAAKFVGVDLAKMLKFKPWGAAKLAKGVNGAVMVLGLALEAWDSWEKMKREDAFRDATKAMIDNFKKQREELVELISGEQFLDQFFVGYIDLQNEVNGVVEDVKKRNQQRVRFHEWRKAGESIDIAFTELKA